MWFLALSGFPRGTLYPRASAPASLATREARRAAHGVGVDLGAGLGLERQALLERQAVGGQRGAPVGEHRRLREGGQRLGVLPRAAERAVVQLGDEPHAE